MIVDAIYGLNNHGPMDGDVVDIGGMIVGNNPVATDAVATRLMGVQARRHRPYCCCKQSRSGGPYKKDDIDIVGRSNSFSTTVSCFSNIS